MFGWFTKKPAAPAYDDRVWIDGRARLDALVRSAREGDTWILPFFEATADAVCDALTTAGVPFARTGSGYASWSPGVRVTLAERIGQVTGSLPDGLRVLVAEHHPLPDDNRALLDALASRTNARPVFFVALDEPLMRRFGGERVAELMARMGLARDEPVEHALVKKSLENARAKVSEKVKMPSPARSMEEWLERNLGA
jgi:hypothetical protein